MFQDMCWHHKMCPYANYPHPNVLPSMPTRKKSNRGMAAIPAEALATDPAPAEVVANGELAEPVLAAEPPNLASAEVQTEIKLFPGVLSVQI